MNMDAKKYDFVNEAIKQVKAELTDLVFQRIAADKTLMTAYMHCVSKSDWGSVNREIGRMVKKAFALENLRREDSPKSNLILSYTQFE